MRRTGKKQIKHYSADVKCIKTNGQTLTGTDAIKGLADDYALFAEHFHEPVYGMISDDGDGYRLFGHAKMFVNLPVHRGEEVRGSSRTQVGVSCLWCFHLQCSQR